MADAPDPASQPTKMTGRGRDVRGSATLAELSILLAAFFVGTEFAWSVPGVFPAGR